MKIYKILVQHSFCYHAWCGEFIRTAKFPVVSSTVGCFPIFTVGETT